MQSVCQSYLCKFKRPAIHRNLFNRKVLSRQEKFYLNPIFNLMISSNVTNELHKLVMRQEYMPTIEILTNNSYKRDRVHIL